MVRVLKGEGEGGILHIAIVHVAYSDIRFNGYLAGFRLLSGHNLKRKKE